jgi:hypothetical protein
MLCELFGLYARPAPTGLHVKDAVKNGTMLLALFPMPSDPATQHWIAFKRVGATWAGYDSFDRFPIELTDVALLDLLTVPISQHGDYPGGDTFLYVVETVAVESTAMQYTMEKLGPKYLSCPKVRVCLAMNSNLRNYTCVPAVTQVNGYDALRVCRMSDSKAIAGALRKWRTELGDNHVAYVDVDLVLALRYKNFAWHLQARRGHSSKLDLKVRPRLPLRFVAIDGASAHGVCRCTAERHAKEDVC